MAFHVRCCERSAQDAFSATWDRDRYKVANCTQAQPVFCGLARLSHGKVISVSALTDCDPGTCENTRRLAPSMQG